jgi:hypothetical protein
MKHRAWYLKDVFFIALILGIVALAIAYAGTRRETREFRFQDGIQASSIGPFIQEGATSVLPMTYGGATAESLTITMDDTGDAEVVMPENAIGPDDTAVLHDTVIFCGENAENGTTYFGPATALFLGDASADTTLGSAACDALDNVTEATADAPLVAGLSYKATGFWCYTDGTLGAAETIDFTLRTAAGDVVTTDAALTTLTCQIAEAGTYCRTVAGSTTDIAAGATVAMKVVQSSDNADDNSWCKVGIALK